MSEGKDEAETTLCVILAGGSSSRFGSTKGFAELNGMTLWGRVLARVHAQFPGKVVFNADAKGEYAETGQTIISDTAYVGEGPLAGLLTALKAGAEAGATSVLTVPVDTPFIPFTLFERLSTTGLPAYASSASGDHPLCGLWPVSLAEKLQAAMADGVRAAKAWVELCGAKSVEFQAHMGGLDPFYNINTPEDLQTALGSLNVQSLIQDGSGPA